MKFLRTIFLQNFPDEHKINETAISNQNLTGIHTGVKITP